MPTGRTALLDLPLPVQGELDGTWGNEVNNGLTEYLDIAIAGITSLTSANFSSGALTINTTEGNAGATNISATSAQYSTFRVSSLAQNSTITVDSSGASLGRSYRLINDDSTYTFTFKATGQTGITLQPKQSAVVAYNGTDYVIIGSTNIPQSGTAKTTAYTLTKADVGDFIEVGSGGSIVIPDAIFSTGDAILVFNNTAGNITITCTITTAYISGTNDDKATITLSTRGVASILFVSGTVCVVTGNVG